MPRVGAVRILKARGQPKKDRLGNTDHLDCLTAKESSSPLLVYHLPHPESLLGSHHTSQHRNNRLSTIVKLYSTLNHSKHRSIKF